METAKTKTFISILLVTALFMSSCRKNEINLVPLTHPAGKVILVFEHFADGKPLLFDTLLYSTSLGNRYRVSDLQYFLSDIVFHSSGGTNYTITDNDSIHYIDAREKPTLEWDIKNPELPAGNYDSVSFTFGLNEKANRSNRFPNPPERDMFWPDILGGGYHYMKMNLEWKNDTLQEPLPFMFHLGIGQIYSGTTHDPDSITGFVQNYFTVTLPGSGLPVKEGVTCIVTIQMNIERWFDGENAFDFSAYPMGIMQDQDGMHKACLNGRKVFTCRVDIVQVKGRN